jgi:hypothetical protein
MISIPGTPESAAALNNAARPAGIRSSPQQRRKTGCGGELRADRADCPNAKLLET